jgi:hypothetical protein
LALGKEVGISAKLGADRQRFPDVPETKNGRRFHGHALDAETAALRRRDRHLQGDRAGGWQFHAHLFFLHHDFRGEIQREAQRQSFPASVLQTNRERSFPPFHQPHIRRKGHGDFLQSPARDNGVG